MTWMIAAHARWNMRAGVLLLLVSSTVSADAGDWTQIPLGTSANLYAIGNTWTSNHLVVGANGFVARSDSTRTHWTTLDPGTSADLYSVVELANEAWMGAGQGVVRLRVYNGWFERDLPSQGDFRLFTRSGGKCVAVGPGGLMFRHTNGAWSAIESGTTANLNGGAGMPFGPAWVIGDSGTILRSTDGGSWNPTASGTTADLHGLAESNLTNLYVVGESGTILKSTDAGASWSPRPSGTTQTLRAISISKTSATHLIAVGFQGTVLRSTDAGDSWCPLSVTSSNLYAVEAFTDMEFLVAGEAGLLLRTTNGGGSCGATGVDPLPIPGALVLAPNPFRRALSMQFALPRNEVARVHVFDAAGRRVRTLVDAHLAAGSHSFSWNGRDSLGRSVAPGVYFVRLERADSAVTRRAVLLR